MFVDYKLGSGFSTRIQLDKKGSYYVDHANSEIYNDNPSIISLFIGYTLKHHKFSLNVDNLSDERYALEVIKDSRGDKAYAAGPPRSVMASYEYIF